MNMTTLRAVGVALLLTSAACGAGPRSGQLQEEQIDAAPACPITVRYALAEPRKADKARLVIEDNPPVLSALMGVVTDVDADEGSGWVHVTVRSSDVTVTYGFYLDSARGRLPDEGQTVAPGDPVGGAHELLDVEAASTDGANPPSVSSLLDEWDCREGLPKLDVLRARLLDGSVWEIELAEPIEVIGAEEARAYGDLTVDGDIVASASRLDGRPDFTSPYSPGADPPVLLEEFALRGGRRAEHWDLAPSHENDTFAYALWVEGPGEHMYFSSGRPIDEVELIAQSLRMTQEGSEIGTVWFDSKRVAIVRQQAVFFLMDPKAPLRGPEVRINTTCGIGYEQGSDCGKAKLDVPVYTPGTRAALEGAILKRTGP
jgi:hypothetical protein